MRGVAFYGWHGSLSTDREWPGVAGMASPGLDGFGSAGMARHVGRDKAQHGWLGKDCPPLARRGWLGLDGNEWPVAALPARHDVDRSGAAKQARLDWARTGWARQARHDAEAHGSARKRSETLARHGEA